MNNGCKVIGALKGCDTAFSDFAMKLFGNPGIESL